VNQAAACQTSAPARGTVNGTLAQGTITAPDPGNACGWTDLAAVVAALQSGNTYVNVHTNDGVAPANTGPGDFPGGEIRGLAVAGGGGREGGVGELDAQGGDERGDVDVFVGVDAEDDLFGVRVGLPVEAWLRHAGHGLFVS